MKLDVKNFIKVFVIFILIDMFWLKLVASKKYRVMIRDIQNEEMKIKMIPGILVYVFMTLLFILFYKQSVSKMFLLGLLTYGVYDFTNLTIINKFDKTFAVYDTVWGGVLFAITYFLASKINF